MAESEQSLRETCEQYLDCCKDIGDNIEASKQVQTIAKFVTESPSLKDATGDDFLAPSKIPDAQSPWLRLPGTDPVCRNGSVYQYSLSQHDPVSKSLAQTATMLENDKQGDLVKHHAALIYGYETGPAATHDVGCESISTFAPSFSYDVISNAVDAWVDEEAKLKEREDLYAARKNYCDDVDLMSEAADILRQAQDWAAKCEADFEQAQKEYDDFEQSADVKVRQQMTVFDQEVQSDVQKEEQARDAQLAAINKQKKAIESGQDKTEVSVKDVLTEIGYEPGDFAIWSVIGLILVIIVLLIFRLITGVIVPFFVKVLLGFAFGVYVTYKGELDSNKKSRLSELEKQSAQINAESKEKIHVITDSSRRKLHWDYLNGARQKASEIVTGNLQAASNSKEKAESLLTQAESTAKLRYDLCKRDEDLTARADDIEQKADQAIAAAQAATDDARSELVKTLRELVRWNIDTSTHMDEAAAKRDELLDATGLAGTYRSHAASICTLIRDGRATDLSGAVNLFENDRRFLQEKKENADHRAEVERQQHEQTMSQWRAEEEARRAARAQEEAARVKKEEERKRTEDEKAFRAAQLAQSEALAREQRENEARRNEYLRRQAEAAEQMRQEQAEAAARQEELSRKAAAAAQEQARYSKEAAEAKKQAAESQAQQAAAAQEQAEIARKRQKQEDERYEAWKKEQKGYY